jgi:hypothetical protein
MSTDTNGTGPSNSDLAQTVQWLVDVERIKQVPQRYAHGLDTRDFDESRSQFADDCEVIGSISRGPIAEYWPPLVAGVQNYQATMHFMGNQFVDHDAGTDRAEVETYAVAYHMEAPETGLPDLVMGVRYCDTLGKRDGAWKIVSRRAIPQWVRGPLPRVSAPPAG